MSEALLLSQRPMEFPSEVEAYWWAEENGYVITKIQASTGDNDYLVWMTPKVVLQN